MFNIGDRVVIIKSKDPSRVGIITTVISEFVTHNPATGKRWDMGGGYLIALHHPKILGSHSCYGPDCLRLIDDGNEVGSWEDCVWQPKELVT